MTSDVTQYLARVRDGDDEAFQEVLGLVYRELKDIAARQLRRERQDHTLQATALVHEAWFRLVDERERRWENRQHFLSVAATAMRRVLMNHARDRVAQKRGAGRDRVTLFEEADVLRERPEDLLALDEALIRLRAFDEKKAQLVELRFFAGLTNEETAEVLERSTRSVERDWRLAKAWLRREVAGADGGDGDAPGDS